MIWEHAKGNDIKININHIKLFSVYDFYADSEGEKNVQTVLCHTEIYYDEESVELSTQNSARNSQVRNMLSLPDYRKYLLLLQRISTWMDSLC